MQIGLCCHVERGVLCRVACHVADLFNLIESNQDDPDTALWPSSVASATTQIREHDEIMMGNRIHEKKNRASDRAGEHKNHDECKHAFGRRKKEKKL
jgi:hypothetical protein